MNVATATPSVIDEAAYDHFLKEVEFECTMCEAVQEDITALNSKIQRLYDLIVEKSKAAKTLKQRADAWVAGFIIASQIRQAACMKKNLHQICGVDLSTIDTTFSSIKERAEFIVGFELSACE